MLEVTEAARDYLADRIAERDPEEACFRIIPKDGRGFTLEEGELQPSDIVIRHDGRPILALEPDVAERLDGWVLDVEGLPGEEQQLLLMPAPDFPVDGRPG